MNRTYRSVWNHKRGFFALNGLAASLMLAFGSSVHALPSGGAVSAGSATIAGGGGAMTINQSSQNVAINWQSFNIAAAEAVRFVQPNSSSVALNRVVGVDASSIMGSLSANGKVFLVNPNGILFAQGAQVNVGGLVASTRNISDSNFMAGNYKFTGSGGGTVVNQGSINANGGYVALLGASVSNEGVISARLGTVALAAGNAMTLDVAGDGLLNVAVNEGAVNALASNGGLIRADGGQVLLTALSAGNLLQSAVNNTGVIQAQTVENRNGTIRLLGDMQSGTVSVGGTLDASGTGAGQTGGNILLTGHHVGLLDGHINASGDAGGGMVLVGGGYQGNNPAIQNASATYMSANSTINVDAITNGNGGTAVLWSNDSTRAYGSITARGGALGGNGGLIETSSHWLDVGGIRVNAGAPNGSSGTWLLDPADITISAAVTSDMPVGPTGGIYAPNTGVNSSNLNTTDLRNALQAAGGTNVTITTTNTGIQGTPASGRGDITIASALTWVVGGSATLTLNAVGDVNINAAVSMTNGNLVVCCGRDINVRAAITGATAGSVSLSAGRDITVVRSLVNIGTDITVTNGNITMCAGREILLSNTLNAPAALITINDSNITAQHGLGLTPGLVLSAGNAATEPGVAGGTVTFTVGTRMALTRAGANPLAVNVDYNPISYTAPTDYSSLFTLVATSPLVQRMLVYPGGADKVFDGTTTAVFNSFKPDINGLIPGGGGLALVAGPGSTANFDNIGPSALPIPITYNGFTLGGATAGFALATPCCGVVARTSGNITAAAVVVPPVVVPPVVVPPVVVPVVVPPVPLVQPIPQVQPMPLFPLVALPLLAGLNLDVGGITMPVLVVEAAPEVAPAPAPVVAPPPPPVYVPTPLPPRRTRN